MKPGITHFGIRQLCIQYEQNLLFSETRKLLPKLGELADGCSHEKRCLRLSHRKVLSDRLLVDYDDVRHPGGRMTRYRTIGSKMMGCEQIRDIAAIDEDRPVEIVELRV